MKNQFLKRSHWLALGTLVMCGVFQVVQAQNELTWDKLGTRTVDYGLDRDVVTASSKETYSSLKIKVNNGLINIHKVTVQFSNGDLQNIDMPDELTKNNDGRLIDLKGNQRIIKQVIFWYDTKNSDKSKAVVEVWARK